MAYPFFIFSGDEKTMLGALTLSNVRRGVAQMATLGYWMESMMAPVFTDEVVSRTRDFFTQYVIPGGALPIIRIGAQPGRRSVAQ